MYEFRLDGQHFHLRLAALPLGPVQDLDLAQKAFLLFAALDPLLTLPVTAVFNLDPGLALR
jgi:hypothetical protein